MFVGVKVGVGVSVGVDGFECDVRLTKDGIAVCFHDRDTNRIAGVKKRVASLTLEELKGITEVMTLEELLELAKLNGKQVLIETKHPVLSGGQIEKRVIELGKQYKFTAMSFSLFAVLRLKRELDDVAFVIAHRWRLFYIPTNKVAIDVELLEKSRWARRRVRNREVLVWTVNEKKYIPKLHEWKVS